MFNSRYSCSEATSLLENTDATNIQSIEVIKNPSVKYDVEVVMVLNIVTLKAISICYKGIYDTVSELRTFKNNWRNLFAGYNYHVKKQFKEDGNYTRFFQPVEVPQNLFGKLISTELQILITRRDIVLSFTLDNTNSLIIT